MATADEAHTPRDTPPRRSARLRPSQPPPSLAAARHQPPTPPRSKWWSVRTRWYLTRGVRHYSRREVAADAAVHLASLAFAAVAAAKLVTRMQEPGLPEAMRRALSAYLAGLLAMLGFSALYNLFAWSHTYVRWLKLLDHPGTPS